MRHNYDYAQIKKEIDELGVTPFIYCKQKGYCYSAVKNGLKKLENNKLDNFKLIVSRDNNDVANNQSPWKLKLLFKNVEVFLNCNSLDKLVDLMEVLKNV